jgi:hypothetical protein
MIENYGEDYGETNQSQQNLLVVKIQNEQSKKTGGEDYELRGHNADEYRTDKESIFSFEQRTTLRTMMSDSERTFCDGGLSTNRTPQGNNPVKKLSNIPEGSFHYGASIEKRGNRNGAKSVSCDFVASVYNRTPIGMKPNQILTLI